MLEFVPWYAPRWVFLLTASCILALASCTIGGASGPLCEETRLDADPSTAPAGATFVVRGANFSRGCRDFGANGAGPGQPEPDTDVQLEFRQGPRIWPLGTVAANEDLVITTTVEVPTDAAPGPATIVATGYYGETEVTFDVAG